MKPEHWSDWIDSGMPCVSIYVRKKLTVVFPLVDLVTFTDKKFKNRSISINKYNFFPLWFSIGPACSHWSYWPGCLSSGRGFDAFLELNFFCVLTVSGSTTAILNEIHYVLVHMRPARYLDTPSITSCSGCPLWICFDTAGRTNMQSSCTAIWLHSGFLYGLSVQIPAFLPCRSSFWPDPSRYLPG